jgi:hypothetical protein
MEKHIVDQIVHLAQRDAGQQNSVDHGSETIIEPAERGAVSGAGSRHQPHVLLRVMIRRLFYGVEFHRRNRQPGAVSQC